jgi:hypothetical protein
MNEFLMTAQDCDWIVAVDSDEFIFPSDYGFEMNQVKSFLSTVPGGHNVLIARMRSVFRNESDEDLDVNNVPVVFQRRHGEKNLMSAINRDYQKPSVIRSKCGISLTVGNHSLNPSPQNIISNRYFVGSHWQNADPSFCVTRRVRDRKERLSDVNMAHSYGNGQYHCTTESILKTCNDHGRDPICI